MESFTLVHTLLIVAGLITFFIAIKPGEKLARYKNLFWVFGNLFFIAAFVFTYIDKGEINYTALAMLLFTNLIMVSQGKPLRNKK